MRRFSLDFKFPTFSLLFYLTLVIKKNISFLKSKYFFFSACAISREAPDCAISRVAAAAAKYEFDFDAAALFGCGRGLLTDWLHLRLA